MGLRAQQLHSNSSSVSSSSISIVSQTAGARPMPGAKMCPSPITETCSCVRPAQPCPGARLTAARLREIGDELQRSALARAPPPRDAPTWKHLSAACRYVLWAVTPAAALALLIHQRRHL